MTVYKLTLGDDILRDDGACIPEDERNADYQAYLQWRDGWTEELEDGTTVAHAPNEPLPADPQPLPPPKAIELASSSVRDTINAHKDQPLEEFEAWFDKNTGDFESLRAATKALAVSMWLKHNAGK